MCLGKWISFFLYHGPLWFVEQLQHLCLHCEQCFCWVPCRKTTFKHRKTSSEWNKAKKQALAAGHSPNTAKAMGRAAAQEVARQIDAGLLKEETAEDVDWKKSHCGGKNVQSWCVCVHVVSQLLVAKHVPGFICKASIMWYAAYALLGERYVTGIREREKERETETERVESCSERGSWELFDSYLRVIWKLFDSYLRDIWELLESYWRVLWVSGELFERYLTVI